MIASLFFFFPLSRPLIEFHILIQLLLFSSLFFISLFIWSRSPLKKWWSDFVGPLKIDKYFLVFFALVQRVHVNLFRFFFFFIYLFVSCLFSIWDRRGEKKIRLSRHSRRLYKYYAVQALWGEKRRRRCITTLLICIAKERKEREKKASRVLGKLVSTTPVICWSSNRQDGITRTQLTRIFLFFVSFIILHFFDTRWEMI